MTLEAGITSEQALERLREAATPIDKYLFLRRLKTEHPYVFFSLLFLNVEETLPFVYTPTVGEACERYHQLPLKTWGLHLSFGDKGSILDKLRAFGDQCVTVVVVTDGERILGLGDLGTGGMGISEGKIMLYTVAAGVNPSHCLPICIDVGTNRQALLDDPQYPGLKHKRITGSDYDEFMDEFVTALQLWQPHILLQFEDFGNHTAFKLLAKYRDRLACFNDDIQGTACVALAGVISAIRLSNTPLTEQKFLFLGAGEAGIGIGELLSMAIAAASGKPLKEARRHCFYVDSKGLVTKARSGLQVHKTAFAHDVPNQADLLSAVHAVQPSVLIGVSTAAGAFNKDVVEAMCKYNTRPVIFPLSNPTHLAECTYEDCMAWSRGKVLFASGSPFEPITLEGVTYHPAQANNAYIFPAIGHAAVICKAKKIPDSVFLVAANSLAKATSLDELERGWLFPPFDGILSISKSIMLAVCEHFEEHGLASNPGNRKWAELIDEAMWVQGSSSKL